jgi:carboxyl-terminal processing protease
MSKSGRIRQDVNLSKAIPFHLKFPFGRFLRMGLVAPALALLLPAQTTPARPGNAPLNSAAKAIQTQSSKDSANTLEPLLKQFVDVMGAVQTQAAEKTPLDRAIYQGAIPSMLRELDPHTQFFNPEQFEQLSEMEHSEQKGFGSIVSVLPGRVIFLQTFPGSPSNKAGIMPGDELVAVNNIAIANLEPEQIVGLLTQARQQQITTFIRRQGADRLLSFVLSPALMDSATVDRAFLLRPGYGYIRVTSWDMQTAKQLRDALTKLGGDQLQGLVLDLRDNPGGVVRAALDGASLFLQPGQRILTAKGRFGEPQTADVPKNAKPYHFRLSVIINGKTASASEILTGALQDHDRAVVVGETSYGKGLVQSVMPLSDRTGLALTTAFYYTPSGRSIQKPLRNSQLSETFAENHKSDQPTYKTDAGRRVTGGGGIQPDIRVYPEAPTRLEVVLDASGSVTQFATKYLSAHSKLRDEFTVTPEVLDEFKVFLAQRDIQPNLSEWTRERNWITSRLKQELITQARGVAAGDEIEMQRDPQVQAALQAVEKDTLAQLAQTRE